MQSGRYIDIPNGPKCRLSVLRIGSGCAGQSLSESLINNAVYPRRGFCDFDILYRYEEMRRKVDLVLPYVIWAPQDGTAGGSANMNNTPQDLYKKFRTGDPIMARPPQAIVAKLIHLVGILRFGANRPLGFANEKEDNRGHYLPNITGR